MDARTQVYSTALWRDPASDRGAGFARPSCWFLAALLFATLAPATGTAQDFAFQAASNTPVGTTNIGVVASLSTTVGSVTTKPDIPILTRADVAVFSLTPATDFEMMLKLAAVGDFLPNIGFDLAGLDGNQYFFCADLFDLESAAHQFCFDLTFVAAAALDPARFHVSDLTLETLLAPAAGAALAAGTLDFRFSFEHPVDQFSIGFRVQGPDGQLLPLSSVPEPGTLLLVACGLIALKSRYGWPASWRSSLLRCA